ncbi:MAG: hypothetical protein ACI8T6_001238 [Candidatus Poseidoniaceae archaeon]|jgi:hypothetical protein
MSFSPWHSIKCEVDGVVQSKTVGYSIAIFAVFIMVIGTVGYTIEGQVEDIPAASTTGFVFFSGEALPSNPAGLFVRADTSITWEREDIFLVIADESKKSQCDSIRVNGGSYIETISDSQTCQYGDTGYEATSPKGVTSVQWHVTSGEYYAGIGTVLDTPPAGTELNIDYEVKLSASFPTYFFSFLFGLGGFGLSRME